MNKVTDKSRINIEINNNTSIQFIQGKDILQKLMKSLLDSKISKLEKNSIEQLSSLEGSKEALKISLATLNKFQKQLSEKINKSKQQQKLTFLYKQNLKTDKNFYKPKTKSNFFNYINNNIRKEKDSKKYKNNSQRRLTHVISRNNINNTFFSRRNKSFHNIQNNYQINLFGNNIHIISNNNDYNNITEIQKRNKTVFNFYKNNTNKNCSLIKIKNTDANKELIYSKINKNNKLIINSSKKKDTCLKSFIKNNKNNLFQKKFKQNNNFQNLIVNRKIDNSKGKKIRKKTPGAEKVFNTKIKKENTNKTNLSNISLDEDYRSKLLSIECEFLAKDELITKPINFFTLDNPDFLSLDLFNNNFVTDDIINNNNERESRIIPKYSIEDLINDDYFKYVLDYLNIKDLISMKNTSKEYRNFVLNYLIDKLKKENSFFIAKNNELQITTNLNIIDVTHYLDNLELSKPSKKALNLLNEKVMNKIFYESVLPNDDILLIYKIFFNMIDSPIKNINNRENFWEECRYFFVNGINGKTGDLLFGIINDKKICLKGENIYNIYNLSKNNLNKIIPSYFSKICGTTGLFVFFIKDVLDYFGISADKAMLNNRYRTYNIIIDYINNKINFIEKFK